MNLNIAIISSIFLLNSVEYYVFIFVRGYRISLQVTIPISLYNIESKVR